MLKARVEKAKSLRSLANEWGVSPAYLSDAVNGKRDIGPALLGAMGIEKVERVTYRRKRGEG